MADSPPSSTSVSRRLRSQPILENMAMTALAQRTADRVHSVRPQSAGYFLYGPPVRLMAGRYRLTIRVRADAPLYPSEPVFSLDITAEDQFQFAWYEFYAKDLTRETLELEFFIPAKFGIGAADCRPIEFRLMQLGNADLSVFDISFRPAEPNEPPAIAPMRHRSLLLAMQTAPLARREVSGVRADRTAGKGRFIFGPPVGLPQGQYRLAVEAEISQLVNRWKPVLVVDVTADGKDVLAQRRFYIKDVLDGRMTIDFAVPPEFAVESGNSKRLEFRLAHHGNADLLISRMVLQEVSASSTGHVSWLRLCLQRLGR